MKRTDYFGEAIRVGRLVRGLSLRQLSEATGIPTWRLSAFERGVSPVRPETFLTIWRFLSSDEARPASAPVAGAFVTTGPLMPMKSERP